MFLCTYHELERRQFVDDWRSYLWYVHIRN